MRAVVAVAILLVACDPHERRSGEYYAGAVDPAAFPAAYLGAGADPARSRSGTVVAFAARAQGVAAPYYAFALSDAQAAAADPLALAVVGVGAGAGVPGGDAAAIPVPLAYVFDPTLAAPRCTPPRGYAYDAQRDAYRLDDQGPVFTALPAAGYAPVVAELPVTSNGEGCQSIKSAATLATASDVVVDAGGPDGRFLAWAIVDPSAEVRFPDGHLDPDDGLGPQKLGWFDHYLVTYLDGGVVPTRTDAAVVRVVPQNLYVPTAIPVTLPSGEVVTGAGALGSGFDLLDAARGEPGYSPLCHVFSFAPADPLAPAVSAAELDPSLLHDTGAFVWCLQVAP
jgi:hypothetical protein